MSLCQKKANWIFRGDIITNLILRWQISAIFIKRELDELVDIPNQAFTSGLDNRQLGNYVTC